MKNELSIYAYYIGKQVDLKDFKKEKILARDPLLIDLNKDRLVAVFRYGVVVMFNCPEDLKDYINDKLIPEDLGEKPILLSEKSRLLIDPDGQEIATEEYIQIKSENIEKFQLIAEILARHLALDYFEQTVIDTFNKLQNLMNKFDLQATNRYKSNELYSLIEDALIDKSKLLGLIQLGDKPDLIWEYPELEKFYNHLDNHFEVRERYKVLYEKLELIDSTAKSLLEVTNVRHSIRLEWYIIILIVFEICLTLYDKIFA